MAEAFINRVATAVPVHEVHKEFLSFARLMLEGDGRSRAVFDKMAAHCGIARRYSVLKPNRGAEAVDAQGFYRLGAFPDTAARMRKFESHAPHLAVQAVERVLEDQSPRDITHLIVTSCTGFSAPGVDLELVESCGLAPDIERTMIGFMGCYAAINALKLARHIVRSRPDARILAVNLELCTLHLHETSDLRQMLSFLLFADGCAAAIISADRVGVRMEGFRAVLIPRTRELIRWHIREQGFDMTLSGEVPAVIRSALTKSRAEILGALEPKDIGLWAVHPGGRSILDAVESAFELPECALSHSRTVLQDYGNMSSSSVMFVLDRLMRTRPRGQQGCAISFGPGLVAETMSFSMAP